MRSDSRWWRPVPTPVVLALSLVTRPAPVLAEEQRLTAVAFLPYESLPKTTGNLLSAYRWVVDPTDPRAFVGVNVEGSWRPVRYRPSARGNPTWASVSSGPSGLTLLTGDGREMHVLPDEGERLFVKLKTPATAAVELERGRWLLNTPEQARPFAVATPSGELESVGPEHTSGSKDAWPFYSRYLLAADSDGSVSFAASTVFPRLLSFDKAGHSRFSIEPPREDVAHLNQLRTYREDQLPSGGSFETVPYGTSIASTREGFVLRWAGRGDLSTYDREGRLTGHLHVRHFPLYKTAVAPLVSVEPDISIFTEDGILFFTRRPADFTIRVRDEDKAPVRDARVELRRPGFANLSLFTDAQGTVALFQGQDRSPIDIVVGGAGMETRTVRVAAEHRAEIVVDVRRGKGLRGQVWDDRTERPLSRFRVHAEWIRQTAGGSTSSGDDWTSVNDPEGMFTLRTALEPPLDVVVEAKGCVPVVQHLARPNGADALSIHVCRHPLRVRVIDSQTGEAVVGAEVRAASLVPGETPRFSEQATGTDGEVRIGADEGFTRLEIKAAGHMDFVKHVSSEATDLSVELPRLQAIKVTTSADPEAPEQSAVKKVYFLRRSGGTLPEEVGKVVFARPGPHVVPGLPPGRYRVASYARTTYPTIADFFIPRDRLAEDLTLAWSAPVLLRGAAAGARATDEVLLESGDIDVRGRWNSEGTFEVNWPSHTGQAVLRRSGIELSRAPFDTKDLERGELPALSVPPMVNLTLEMDPRDEELIRGLKIVVSALPGGYSSAVTLPAFADGKAAVSLPGGREAAVSYEKDGCRFVEVAAVQQTSTIRLGSRKGCRKVRVRGIDGDPAVGVQIVWYARLGGDFAELFRSDTDDSGEAPVPNGPEGRLFLYSMSRSGSGFLDIGQASAGGDALQVSLADVSLAELRIWDADSRAPIEATNVTLLDSKGRRGPLLRLVDSDGRFVVSLPQGLTGAEIWTVAYRVQRVEALKANDRRDVALQPE